MLIMYNDTGLMMNIDVTSFELSMDTYHARHILSLVLIDSRLSAENLTKGIREAIWTVPEQRGAEYACV